MFLWTARSPNHLIWKLLSFFFFPACCKIYCSYWLGQTHSERKCTEVLDTKWKSVANIWRRGWNTTDTGQLHAGRIYAMTTGKCFLVSSWVFPVSSMSHSGRIDLWGEDVATTEQSLLQSSGVPASLGRATALTFNHMVRCLLNNS